MNLMLVNDSENRPVIALLHFEWCQRRYILLHCLTLIELQCLNLAISRSERQIFFRSCRWWFLNHDVSAPLFSIITACQIRCGLAKYTALLIAILLWTLLLVILKNYFLIDNFRRVPSINRLLKLLKWCRSCHGWLVKQNLQVLDFVKRRFFPGRALVVEEHHGVKRDLLVVMLCQ